MALDTTVGGAAADSYLTVAEADALAGSLRFPFATEWIAETDQPTKEAKLRQAAIDIGAYVRVGAPYLVGQALTFPRETDLDASDDPLIPGAVQRAQAMQAAYLLENAKTIENAATRRARGMFSFSDDDGSGSIAIDPTVGLLSPSAEAELRSIAFGRGLAAGTIRVRTSYNS